MRPSAFALCCSYFFLLAPLVAPEVQAQIPLGPALPANAHHADEQNAPSVALAQDGSAVLVFSGTIYGNKHVRWLDKSGLARGAEPSLHVAGGSVGYNIFQDLAVARGGRGAACWEAEECVCRQLDTGGFLGAEEIRCSDTPYHFGDREFDPRVKTLADSSYVVSWMKYVNPDISSPDELLLDASVRFFSATGVPLGPTIVVAPQVGGELQSLDIAVLGGGRIVAAWSGGQIDGDSLGIRARIVAPSGALLSEPFPVNTYYVGQQNRPNLASNLKDRFVATWESEGQDGSGSGVYGQLFDDHGNKLGGEFQVSSDAPTWQGLPAVAMDRSGRFVVAFYSAYETEDRAEDIILRAYRADGTPLGPQIFVSEADSDPLDYPAVSLSDSGLIQVAYQAPWYPPEDPDGNYDILTRRFVLPCEGDAYTLCLKGGRFAVRAFWRNSEGAEDLASRIPLSADTGGFYFFDPSNFELHVKVLDGCAINQHFWVFAAGLTDVGVDVLITDTFTGTVRTYSGAEGQAFAPIQDLEAFEGCGTSAPAGPVAPPATPAAITANPAAGQPTELCASSPDTLCLADGRFRVKAHWADFLGQSGPAFAVPQSGSSGLFYFFEENNLEVAIKVLDGCAINGKFWVYAAGLTNVEVTLTVEDLVGGSTWQRSNPLGIPFQPILDSSAFGTCLP